MQKNNIYSPKNEISVNPDGKLSELATGSLSKLLWQYSLPAVVGMVVMSLYNVIDRIFIGQGVGTEAIAGLAITFPVMNVSAALGVLIGAGAAARISIMLGARDHKSAERVLGNSLVMTIVLGLSYITFFALFLDDILRAFGASDATLPYAHDFISTLLPGLLLTNIAFSFNNIMRASGYPVRAMVTMFIGAGTNLVLAPIFIFWLDMGIRGAAIATDLAMLCSATFVMGHFFMPKTRLRFRRGIYKLSGRILWGIVTIGAAPSLINFASSIINVLINRSLVGYGSDLAVAAAGIFTTYTSLIVMVVVGICQGLQPIIGYNYGAGHLGRLKGVYYIACGWSTGVMVFGFVLGMFFPSLIARAFTTDPELIRLTTRALKITMVMFWVVGFQVVSTTFFQSIGKAFKSIILSLSRQVIFIIPLLWFLPPRLGLDGVWWAFPISDTLATTVTAILIWWQFRHLNRYFTPSHTSKLPTSKLR